MYKTKSTLDYKRGHGATTNDPDAIDYATSIVEKYLWQGRRSTSRTSGLWRQKIFLHTYTKIKGAFLWLGNRF